MAQLNAADWSALGTWATALVASVAGVIALRQVQEARRLREEQAQPYVVVYMEPSGATPQIIDLVVRNFGRTSAYNVVIDVDPPLERSIQGGETEPVWMFGRLPVLVPGQEWRTMWDFGPSRAQSDLPSRHSATVKYEDSRQRPLPPLEFLLDWSAYRGRRWVTVYSLHDAAKALRDIERTMKKWQESIHGGLAVFVRDADAKDRSKREQYEQALQERREASPERPALQGKDDPDAPA